MAATRSLFSIDSSVLDLYSGSAVHVAFHSSMKVALSWGERHIASGLRNIATVKPALVRKRLYSRSANAGRDDKHRINTLKQ
jgi:hypothetical protein